MAVTELGHYGGELFDSEPLAVMGWQADEKLHANQQKVRKNRPDAKAAGGAILAKEPGIRGLGERDLRRAGCAA